MYVHMRVRMYRRMYACMRERQAFSHLPREDNLQYLMLAWVLLPLYMIFCEVWRSLLTGFAVTLSLLFALLAGKNGKCFNFPKNTH